MVSLIEPLIEVHLGAHDLHTALRDDVRDALTSSPKELSSPKWLYDERGSELFGQITRLEEYYPTNAEREVLSAHAGEIMAMAGADTMVELGSGTTDKTRALLDAGRAAARLQRFIPFDVSEEVLRESASALASAYPGLHVHGVVGDFDRHLDRIPHGGRRLVVLLGGTIGNSAPVARKDFLTRIVEGMRTGDHLLLGTDLVKDVGRLQLAYDDPSGVTAAFNKNVLSVMNRELGSDFVLERFAHVARWDGHAQWMDLGLRSLVDQRVRVEELGIDVDFAAGEVMRTEVSAKFTLDVVRAELAAVGLHLERWYTDRRGDWAASLSVVR